MTIPFDFQPLLVFGFMSAMLILGVSLRAKVGLIQRFLFPSCLVGGVIGLVLVNLQVVPIQASDLENFAYHLFNISFISVGLTAGEPPEQGQSGQERKELLRGSAWMALVQGVVFPIQAIIGGAWVLLLGALGVKLFPTFGFLVPLGFNEGPGQALSMGKVWETMGFEHGGNIGITFASLGFFFAFFVGVPLANRGIRRGWAFFKSECPPRSLFTGINEAEECEPAGRLTLHSGNVDNLTFQAALVGLVYALTYFLIRFLNQFLGADDGKIMWGFFFFFGLLIASGVRWAMTSLGAGRLIDPGMQRRITGWSVDFLIVATVSAIQTVLVVRFLLPIALIAISAGVATTLVVTYFGRRSGSYQLEKTLAIYGTTTGVVSSGLLLMRIVDPNFKTPVAVQLGMMNLFAAPVVLIGLIVVNAPLERGWGVPAAMAAMAGVMTVSLVLLRALRLWGPPAFVNPTGPGRSE